ncbi:MAG: 8-oxo-dGTP diphosphatase MutT [Desulfuromonadia bacterium]
MGGVQVACALIERGGKVFVARRSHTMTLPLKWEFPGGKIEPGETAVDALCREITEELAVTVEVIGTLPPTIHHYPTLTVTLHPFRCRLTEGEITLSEHLEGRWVHPADLSTLDLAVADRPVVESYLVSIRN